MPTLGIGIIVADFHTLGKLPSLRQKMNSTWLGFEVAYMPLSWLGILEATN